jgi:hypothetical protein
MPPAAGFAPLAQSSGRVKAIVVVDSDQTDLQVATGMTTVDVSIMEWKLNKKVASSGKLVTVENAADSFRVIGTRRLSGGIGEWSVRIKVAVNSDSAASASSFSRFPVGAFLVFDLIRHKTRGAGYGHFSCFAKIVEDDSEGAGTVGDPQTQTFVLEGDGLLPSPTFIS